MNLLYFLGTLLLPGILGYPYAILVVASKQEGAIRLVGFGLAGLFVLVLVLAIVFYRLGIAKMPALRSMAGRASTRMRRGMSGYMTGMMTEDEKAIDDLIDALKANPQLFESFKRKIQA